MNTRRDFLKQAGLFTGTAVWGRPDYSGGEAEAAGKKPNIIIILTDDQGYGDIGCFGAKGFSTPNLDRLAAEGRKFTNFHVAQAVCSASRAGLLTGCYPNRIGIHGALGPKSRHGLGPKEMTLAELVKQRGYATGIIGKWHLGHLPPFLPTRHGFDQWFGLPYSNDMWPFHPEAKPGTYPPLPLFENETVVNPNVTWQSCRFCRAPAGGKRYLLGRRNTHARHHALARENPCRYGVQ